MKLLYSDILPAGLEENQITVTDCFNEQISDCYGVDIAVGYVSKRLLRNWIPSLQNITSNISILS